MASRTLARWYCCGPSDQGIDAINAKNRELDPYGQFFADKFSGGVCQQPSSNTVKFRHENAQLNARDYKKRAVAFGTGITLLLHGIDCGMIHLWATVTIHR
jgi:hypothetical protein